MTQEEFERVPRLLAKRTGWDLRKFDWTRSDGSEMRIYFVMRARDGSIGDQQSFKVRVEHLHIGKAWVGCITFTDDDVKLGPTTFHFRDMKHVVEVLARLVP